MAVSELTRSIHRHHSESGFPGDRGFPAPDNAHYGPNPSAQADGVQCDTCALLASLIPGLQRYIASGADGGGNNSGAMLTDDNPQQIAYPNPRRVAFGVSIPSGSFVYHGFTKQVSASGGSQTSGTPVPQGSTWLYGPEWTGSVWIVGAAPFPIDVRILEISSPQ